MARKLIVEILGDSKSLERSFNQSTAAAQKFGANVDTGLTRTAGRADSAFKKIQGGLAGAFVGGAAASAAIAGIKTIVSAASDLNEQITKNQQVFKQSGAEVVAWSQTTAKSIGVSETAALDAAGTFGNLFAAIGTAPAEAAKTSKSLVKLAADLASFNNASIEDTLLAIRSGLVGEAEPLRRYGVLLSEARVQQVAMAQTGKDNAKALTVQEKAAARVAIIFKDTARAQGDFARTSGGLANQQRILSANTKDLEANLGTLLLPVIQELTVDLNKAATAAVRISGALVKLGKLKIPTIVIPFTTKQVPGTGSTAGSLFGKVAGLGILATISPAGVIALITKKVIDSFDSEASLKVPDMADAFRKSVGEMVDTSLERASSTPIPVDPNKIKGFGTGLLPSDLFGPLIKDVSQGSSEALLDAQIAKNTNRQRNILVGQRDRLLKALDDPRLKAKGRVEIKQKILGITGAIDAIDAEIQSGIDAANAKRTERLNKLEADARKAAEKHKALLKKIADHRAKLAEQAREALQTRQFRAIGLGAEGDPIIPTVANLRKQFAQLGDNIEPGQLSSKLRKQFAGVGRLLRGDLGKVTEATRDAINNLFRTIRDTFDKGGDVFAISPATTALNKNKIVQGLGLDRHTEQLIKSRLSGFNAAGRALNPARGTTGAFGITLPPIHVNTTVNLDGQKVAQNTSIHQGKNRRSNPRQKRGPWSGGGWS